MKKKLPIQLLLALFLSCFITAIRAQAPTLRIQTNLPAEGAKQVVYGNGIYLAELLSPVRFYKSVDGISWSLAASPIVSDPPVLAYGAGLFVCAGDSGKIFTSSDGSTWTRRESGRSTLLYDLKFLQGKFYAVGDSATFLQSANGIDWNELSTGLGTSTDSYRRILYGRGYFVIDGYNNSNTQLLFRSDAGSLLSWTSHSPPAHGNLAFLKSYFYSFGNAVQTSTDAVNWSTIQAFTYPYSNSLPSNGFTDSARVYLLGVADSNLSTYGAVFPSTDGITFAAPILTDEKPTDGVYVGHRYFIYGGAGIESSTDGAGYQQLGAEYNVLASDSNSTYVAAGGANGVGLIYSSQDFTTWTKQTAPHSITFGGLVFDGSRFVATDGPTVWASPNGTGWSAIGPLVYGNRSFNLGQLAYGNGRYFAIGGFDGNAVSGDGVNWYGTFDQNLENMPLQNVKFLNGNFFATATKVTTSGLVPAILVSSSGQGWTDISPNLPFMVYNFGDIIYDGSNYYVTGTEGNPNTGVTAGFFSVSTANIMDPNAYGVKGTVTTPPAGIALSTSYAFSFAYSHGHFTGGAYDLNAPVSGNGYLLYSSDGQHWDASPLGFTGALIGNVAKGDTFRLLSASNVAIIASFSNMLPTDSLIDFDARAIARSALLTWRIKRDDNVSHFIVRRSADGIHWDSIGSVDAIRRKYIERNYHFIDDDPMTGFNYYQLLLIGTDGSQRVSPVRRLFFGRREVRVYPNPAFGSCTVELPEAGPGVVTLYSSSGHRVLRQEFNGQSVTLSLHGLPRGVYHLSVMQNGKLYNKEILHL